LSDPACVALPLERPRPLDPSSVTRTEVVHPAMCGHNPQFVGHIGDWTWDAVSALCGTDVLCARNSAGAPAYLSFYYFRIRGSRRFHLRTPTFGDRLQVTSQLFGFGSESVLVLHRIARSPAGGAIRPADESAGIDPHEFYAFGDEDSLYVENFNHWITRSDAHSNRDLVRSSPEGFRHQHLPGLPEPYSPRHACRRARTRLTFLDHDTGLYLPAGPPLEADYAVDLTRDINGVGLLYFAAYFSIVDWALLRLWRRLGRADRSFLGRVVFDQQMCYLGNADADCVVGATVERFRVAGDDSREAVNVVLRDREADRPIAVCTLHLLTGGVLRRS
jgi:probable biosynthetic protein (TIGR04098 family)